MSDPVRPPVDPLQELIDRLVPPKAVEIVDLLGNAYRIPTTVSARQNVKLVRELQEMLSEPAVLRAVSRFDSTGGAGLAEMVVQVAGVVSSEEVIDHFAIAFEHAHPAVLLEARLNWLKDDPTRTQAQAADLDGADLFAVEELASAILPLFVGLAKRSVGMLRAAVPGAPVPAT